MSLISKELPVHGIIKSGSNQVARTVVTSADWKMGKERLVWAGQSKRAPGGDAGNWVL